MSNPIPESEELRLLRTKTPSSRINLKTPGRRPGVLFSGRKQRITRPGVRRFVLGTLPGPYSFWARVGIAQMSRRQRLDSMWV
jgi:hypothetical protein